MRTVRDHAGSVPGASVARVRIPTRRCRRPQGRGMGRGMAEPFRVLFPLGVLVGWVGVGHWLAYGVGVITQFSCLLHGVIQMQAFVGAFAAGFLLTALPRRTGSPPASRGFVAAVCLAVAVMVWAGALETWWIAEPVAIGFNL